MINKEKIVPLKEEETVQNLLKEYGLCSGREITDLELQFWQQRTESKIKLDGTNEYIPLEEILINSFIRSFSGLNVENWSLFKEKFFGKSDSSKFPDWLLEMAEVEITCRYGQLFLVTHMKHLYDEDGNFQMMVDERREGLLKMFPAYKMKAMFRNEGVDEYLYQLIEQKLEGLSELWNSKLPAKEMQQELADTLIWFYKKKQLRVNYTWNKKKQQ